MLKTPFLNVLRTATEVPKSVTEAGFFTPDAELECPPQLRNKDLNAEYHQQEPSDRIGSIGVHSLHTSISKYIGWVLPLLLVTAGFI